MREAVGRECKKAADADGRPKNCSNDRTVVAREMDADGLRRELERMLAAIAEEGELRAETIEKAAVLLEATRTVRRGGGRKSGSPPSSVRTKGDGGERAAVVPADFVCPISGELMRDPVIVSTGQMITDWANTHGIQIPPYDKLDGVTVTQGERNQLDNLLNKISSPSIAEQKQAAKELRLLTKRASSFRALLGEKSSSISQLVSPLASPDLDKHSDLHEDVVTTILNVSIHDNNKKIVGDDPRAIPLLIDAVRSGEMGARSNAAAALFTLSALRENKLKIGELGAFKPLIKLLEEGSTVARKDAASAIFSLCVDHENKRRAIEDGLVVVLLKSIGELIQVDESLAVLAMLASDDEALEELCDNGGVPLMLGIIRSSDIAKSRENAAVVLHSIFTYDPSMLREIREEENASGCISLLAQNGTSRARRKAMGILGRINRGAISFLA